MGAGAAHARCASTAARLQRCVKARRFRAVLPKESRSRWTTRKALRQRGAHGICFRERDPLLGARQNEQRATTFGVDPPAAVCARQGSVAESWGVWRFNLEGCRL